jgi:hypothetical protein
MRMPRSCDSCAWNMYDVITLIALGRNLISNGGLQLFVKTKNLIAYWLLFSVYQKLCLFSDVGISKERTLKKVITCLRPGKK